MQHQDEFGAHVSIWTVARELGHKSTAMIEDRYGHLAGVRDRSGVVEYRVEAIKKLKEKGERAAMKERLEALQA